MTRWLCVAGLATACVALAAQDAQDGGVETLHAYTNLVQIPTLVLNEDREPFGQAIDARRFFVSLDGGPRFRVSHVRLEADDPISLAIVLDVSQPFPEFMRKMDEAVGGLAPLSLKPRDHVTVYSMDCSLTRAIDDMPAEAGSLKAGVDVVLEAWRMHGRARWQKTCKAPSNLWDSLMYVTSTLREVPGRRVILAVTDGVDRGSKASGTDVRVLAQASGVAIFGMTQTINSIGFYRPSDPEISFNGVCELSGGMVLKAESKTLAEELQRFVALLRGRYIVEFPHPVDTEGGHHGMEITVDKADAFIRPAGIAIPVDDPAILNDPTTLRNDPTNAPQLGKRKVLGPN